MNEITSLAPQLHVSAIPEPSTWAMLAIAFFLLLIASRIKRPK